MDIAQYIDHTLLKPTATKEDIEQLCREAISEQFAAVCVPPCYVQQAATLLKDSTVKTATVIGFPLGYNVTRTKLNEIDNAINDGADELDMVHNITALKNNNIDYLKQEISQCLEMAHNAGKTLKVILETALLTKEEIVTCCKIYGDLSVDFVKTSTGFNGTGAETSIVQLMRTSLPQRVNIKASGGIRSFAFAKELIDAGANRIGTSSAMIIVKESKEQ